MRFSTVTEHLPFSCIAFLSLLPHNFHLSAMTGASVILIGYVRKIMVNHLVQFNEVFVSFNPHYASTRS